jgi:hypothetical protein
MTDFCDACLGCGGHLRRNVYSGTLCPECEERHELGEITALGDPIARIEAGNEVIRKRTAEIIARRAA